MRNPANRLLPCAILALALGFAVTAGGAVAQVLRIGTAEDPDALDPAQSGTLGARYVFASLCDKLVDISPSGEIVPYLATSWEIADDQLSVTFHLRDDVTFHDGEKFNAAAVKFNIERAQTLPESKRKAELSPVSGVEVIDDDTVKFNLSAPFAPLLAMLSDRAGVMVSPKAAGAMTAAEFGNNPVCSGPFKFDRRVPQEGIYLNKFDDYWNAENVHFDEVRILIIPDATVRLANVQSGQLDIAERIQATDLERGKADDRIVMYTVPSLSYNHLHINLNNGPRSDTVLAKSPELREALDLAIDREALVQAVSNGVFLPGNQLVTPTSPFYAKEFPVQPRDIDKARQLVTDAGFDRVEVSYQLLNDTLALQVAQIIQAMVKDAGFDLKLEPQETGTAVQRYFAGDFELFNGLWSGRVDPDGNFGPFVSCEGAQNFGKYCSEVVDAALSAARQTTDIEERRKLYAQATEQLLKDRPTIPIFHQVWVFAATEKLKGFEPYVDDIVRPVGLTLED